MPVEEKKTLDAARQYIKLKLSEPSEAWVHEELDKDIDRQVAMQNGIDELCFFWRWIERAFFDNSLSERECLGIIVHSPYAPWSFDRERWDTSHKEYDFRIDEEMRLAEKMRKFYDVMPSVHEKIQRMEKQIHHIQKEMKKGSTLS